MRATRLILPIVLILFFFPILLQGLFFKFVGFSVIFRIGMSMSTFFTPKEINFRVWQENPIPNVLKVKITNPHPLPSTGNKVGGGHVDLAVELRHWAVGFEGVPIRPIIFVQKVGEQEEILHYKILVSKISWNIRNFISYIIIIGCVIVVIVGSIWIGILLKQNLFRKAIPKVSTN